jgi:hypothetical protein
MIAFEKFTTRSVGSMLKILSRSARAFEKDLKIFSSPPSQMTSRAENFNAQPGPKSSANRVARHLNPPEPPTPVSPPPSLKNPGGFFSGSVSGDPHTLETPGQGPLPQTSSPAHQSGRVTAPDYPSGDPVSGISCKNCCTFTHVFRNRVFQRNYAKRSNLRGAVKC